MISPEAALCSLFYCTISGQPISTEVRAAALEHWSSLTDTPWRTASAYGEAFFQGVGNMPSMQPLLQRWAKAFDSNGMPLESADRLAFLQDFLSTLLHSPHNYHDFFYINPTLANSHPMDWDIVHPIATDFWSIYFCLEGAGELHAKSQVRKLPPGTACILSPGCEAVLRRDEAFSHWSFGWLNFRLQLGWFESMDWAFSVNQPTVLDCGALNNSSKIRTVLDELASIDYTPADTSEKLCHNLIESLLLRLRRIYESGTGGYTPQGTARLPDRRVACAAEYILNHYHESFKLAEVAEYSNLSANRLNELFREHYETSVMQWRDIIRLSKARELLLHTELNISAVAAAVGWEDPLYFSRRFSHTYGTSPRKFRMTGINAQQR